MNIKTFTHVLLASVLLISAGTGCKRKPTGPTPLTGSRTQPPQPEGGTTTPIDLGKGGTVPTGTEGTGVTGTPTKGDGTIDNTGLEQFENMIMDRNVFKANTVYFEFDKATVKTTERTKIEEVSAYLKGTPQNKLLIEGHCDERGTEEYNRSLGERRAQALREYLSKLGISADRVRTISYGEDKPADAGHDEAAWAKNRRGEFILLKPKAGAQ